MGEEEPQAVVHLGERRVDDFGGQEVREHLFRPHVVEPVHGDEVAEPHVRGLVGDQAGPPEIRGLGGRLVQQEAGRAVEDRAGVLHPPVLEGRDQHEVELAERIGDPGVVLEPVEGGGVQVEDGLPVARHLGRVGLAMEHPQRAAGPLRRLDLELPGREGEQVGGDGLRLGEAPDGPFARAGRVRRLRGLAVGHRGPAAGRFQGQRETRLQVGLIEEGQREVRPVGHEERIQKVVVPVEGFVARLEVELDPIAPVRAQGAGGNDDVVVPRRPLHGRAVGPHCAHSLRRVLEVEHHVAPPGVRPREAHLDRPGDGPVPLARDSEAVAVSQVGQGRGPALGQGPGHPFLDVAHRHRLPAEGPARGERPERQGDRQTPERAPRGHRRPPRGVNAPPRSRRRTARVSR